VGIALVGRIARRECDKLTHPAFRGAISPIPTFDCARPGGVDDECAMRVQIGKKTADLSRPGLEARAAGYAQVLIDVGTGDGRFPYAWAAEHPDTLCIGVDAVGDAMREVSHRATRKPARGGRENVLFAVAAVEALPPELTGLATQVTVNFPWGSLLRAIVEPQPRVLAGLRALLREGGRWIGLINMSVLEDRPYAERLGLPEVTDSHVKAVLGPAYRAAGLEITGWREVAPEEIPHRTTWGQHLTHASQRKTNLREARAVQSPGS